MKSVTALCLTYGLLAGFCDGAETVTGDFQDHFDQSTLQPAWQSHQVINGAALPMGWRVDQGILRGNWGANWGQEHLTVETSMDQFTIQVRCRIESAGSKDSGAGLILKAEYPARFCAFSIGNGSYTFGRLFSNSSWDFPKRTAHPGLQLGTWHTLKAEINGSHIRCFLDEEMVYETDQPAFTGNHYGVGAIVKADVSFDDVQIAPLAPELPAATSRAVGTGQFIDTGWPMGTGSQEKVTFMIVADPAGTDPTNPAPAKATVVMDSPAIQKLFGQSLVWQGTPDKYVVNPIFTQDPKLPKEIHFQLAGKLIVAFFNDNGQPGNNPDSNWADWVLLSVTDASSGNPLLVVTGPLTSGDVMDFVPLTDPPVAPKLSVSTMMRVCWPYSLAPYSLQGAETVDGNWKPVDAWVIDQGGEHQAFLPMSSAMKFFRLVESK